MMPQPDAAGIALFATRPRAVFPVATLLLVALVASGCSRLGFIRPDTSRRGFESTAHEVVITNNGRSGASAALARVQMAQARLGEGDLAAAEQQARKALKLDADSAAAYTVLALVEDRRGHAAPAGKYYLRAAELAPTQGGMLNNYGIWLCSQGRGLESLGWFERALAAPGYQTPSIALANRGQCALQTGQTAQAEQSLRQALDLDPRNQVALSAMAELEFKAGRAMAARAFSERRLAAAPADSAALQLASQIEYKLGDRKAAEAYVQRLVAEFPGAQGNETGDGGKK